jgi:hypothetical protein
MAAPSDLLGWEAGEDGQGRVEKGAGRLLWLQSWLQLVAFLLVRRRARPYLFAGHAAYGTAANRLERDHDGLAVRGPIGSRVCSRWCRSGEPGTATRQPSQQ